LAKKCQLSVPPRGKHQPFQQFSEGGQAHVRKGSLRYGSYKSGVFGIGKDLKIFYPGSCRSWRYQKSFTKP
jgi:hypothetical protein